MAQEWPLYYAKELVLGDAESSVGVCTLWTDRTRIAEGLDPAEYAVVGNLYSLWGINYILRNVLANPHIRHLVICGSDRSGSGKALLALFEQGVDASHAIPGENAVLDTSIPLEAIELFRRSVRPYDLRGQRDAAEVARLVEGMESLPPFAEPQSFPEASARGGRQRLPSEKTGFRVEEETVARAWLRVLWLVLRYGTIKPSDYAEEQRELLNVMAVIHHEDPDEPHIPDWLPLTRQTLERYYPQLIDAQDPSRIEQEVSYTYGDRLRAYRGRLDQLQALVDRLKSSPHSRRAVAVTWDAEEDALSESPPCLTELDASLQEGQLFLTAHFRSHDILSAWPANAFALRKLQGQLAQEIGATVGPLTITSHSAHIYGDRARDAMLLLRNRYPHTQEWQDDPRGNFLISIEEGYIVAEHATTERGKTGVRFQGKTAKQVYNEIVNQQLLSLYDHAAYLGAELYKAELALRQNLSYTQDKDLTL